VDDDYFLTCIFFPILLSVVNKSTKLEQVWFKEYKKSNHRKKDKKKPANR